MGPSFTSLRWGRVRVWFCEAMKGKRPGKGKDRLTNLCPHAQLHGGHSVGRYVLARCTEFVPVVPVSPEPVGPAFWVQLFETTSTKGSQFFVLYTTLGMSIPLMLPIHAHPSLTHFRAGCFLTVSAADVKLTPRAFFWVLP